MKLTNLGRRKYYDKIVQEFKDNPSLVKKAVGRYNIETILNNQKAYDTFKQRIRQGRSRLKEREKISKEYQKIQERFVISREKKEKSKTKYLKSSLAKKGYSARDIRKILVLKKEQNLSMGQILNSRTLNQSVAKQTFDALTDEFVYYDKSDETTKSKAGALRRFFKDPKIKAEIDKFMNKIILDKNALHNAEIALQYFLDTIIPNKYEEWQQKASRFVQPTESFYINLVKELNNYYDKLQQRNS